MDAILDDLRQPTSTEGLSPAFRRYLLERLAAVAPQPLHEAHTRLRLYQCLGDPVSAEVLAQDLLRCAREDAASCLVALFECPAACRDQGMPADFASALRQHLALMRAGQPEIGEAELLDPARERYRLRVQQREFELLALHADAAYLSQVLPCPVLLLQPR
jgi:FPC/CPF motif-containing protein YcgG